MHFLCAAAICFWCFKQDNFCPLYEKRKGGGLSPPGKFQNVNHFRILSFKMETLNRPSFNEICEMTCITHASLSPRETLNPPKFINPLHVVQQSCGKCRLIWDLSYLNRFMSKIFALCLICFSQVIFSSPSISNAVTITSKFFRIIASNWVLLGILARSLNSSFLLFCLLVCPPCHIFSVN